MPIRETQQPSVLNQWKGINQRIQPSLVPDGFFTFAKGVYFGLGDNCERLTGKKTAGKLSAPIFNIAIHGKIAMLQTMNQVLMVPVADLLNFTVT